ncbi:MAG: DUF2130 domain-containing protein, partial [Muribaculaceae bacterium]|nr:DUF2130 domain-containing protein [Muribaculaceae bacterium]
PKCGHVFHVDQEVFESLASQVRTMEFTQELDRRVAEMRRQLAAEEEVRRLNAEQAASRRHAEEIGRRDRELAELRAQAAASESRRQVAVLQEQQKAADELNRRDAEISRLRGLVDNERNAAAVREAAMRQNHAVELSKKDEIINYFKDLKSRMSTKMVGESLEIHCATLFEQSRAMGLFPDAFFDKDNDARTGSKGDFIFRDYMDGVEYVSIMFEMKNESDTPGVKHKNVDFLDKLNRDRNEKKCEYAVLVSLLERDSDLYNEGIVNMSHRYPKMFVIRPQMFMTLITLLCQASRKNIQEIRSLRQELAVAQAQSLDVTNFERRRDKFVASFSRLVEMHTKKHNEALDNIDKVIQTLEKQIDSLRKVKALFETSQQKLVQANSTAESDFTIKKLTYGNPTMRALFDEARKNDPQDEE